MNKTVFLISLLNGFFLFSMSAFGTPLVTKTTQKPILSLPVATKSPVLRPKTKAPGTVQLQIRVIRMSRGRRALLPQPPIKHLPLALMGTYGFNPFRSLKLWQQTRLMKQKATLSLSSNYRFQVRPLSFKKRENSIRLETTLFRKDQRQRFQISVQTVLRLRQGRTMAFLGPPLQKGRLLLLLSARLLP